MADYHIIEGNRVGDEYRIVFHVDVPNQMNKTNTCNLRAAVAEDPAIKKPSIIPWVSQEEQDQLNTGELIEISESFRPEPSLTLVQNRQRADNRFREIEVVTRDYLINRYGFWRFEREVP